MRADKDALPIAIDVEGAEVRETEFGGMISGQLTFGADTGLRPLLTALPNERCQRSHQGSVVDGQIEVTYENGSVETINAGDLYSWWPGHTVRFASTTSYVEFGPSEPMPAVFAHVKGKKGLA